MGLTNWELLKVVRDANVVRGAQRHVLFALCLRANTTKNYTCFPSYAQLIEDSAVGLSQLKIAVRGLETAGWIRRQPRGRTSNLFFINVPKLQKAAEERRQAFSGGGLQETDDPFGANSYTDDRDNTDGLETTPEAAAIPDWLNDMEGTDNLVGALQDMFPEHPIFADPRGKEYLRSDMERCIELAGTPFRCGHVLYHAYEDDGIRTAVGLSKKLGLYILKCFPQWLIAYRDRLVGMGYSGEGEEL
jgi:hypothetical protein